MPMLSVDLERAVDNGARVVALFSRDGVISTEVVLVDGAHWLYFDVNTVLRTGEVARELHPDDYGMGHLVLN